MNGNIWFDSLAYRAKHGPRYHPVLVAGTCSYCGGHREERWLMRWMGYRACADCAPDLLRALVNAPERCDCEFCARKRLTKTS